MNVDISPAQALQDLLRINRRRRWICRRRCLPDLAQRNDRYRANPGDSDDDARSHSTFHVTQSTMS